jgi:hypothetical protein
MVPEVVREALYGLDGYLGSGRVVEIEDGTVILVVGERGDARADGRNVEHV